MYIGVDIGSVALKAVVMDDRRNIVWSTYRRTRGRAMETALAVLEELFEEFGPDFFQGIAATGAGGKLLAEVLDLRFVNEIIAQSAATIALHPDVRTIIEIGGEDSKLILLDTDDETGALRVADFAMNAICAAGTGSFLDQQASRLGVTIEEFGRMALRSESPPRIAGRCSVFAKSDMIHLQQTATPDYDIVAGLCCAMARNYKSSIGKGKEFRKAIAFQGGVAANPGMVRAFTDVLELDAEELVIPEHFAEMGAIGAVLVALESGSLTPPGDLAPLRRHLEARDLTFETHAPLVGDDYPIHTEPEPLQVNDGTRIPAYLGVDVGSISTNVVVIDEHNRVLARRYLMTAGRPLEAVTRGLYEVGLEVADKVEIMGACTTGSGRYLTADFISADIAKNEITAHATAAVCVNKDVDTILEIGGQDSKYTSLANGTVIDFAMNKVCAAGTGSFLEEQAERLGVNIIDEFGEIALSATAPVHLGERCTVFMETDLNHRQQQGADRDDLIAGLCYSIVLNYLNRVVEDRAIGDVIFFQGGVTANRGVKAAFESVLGKKVIVPPHHDVMGAIGAAIIARDNRTWQKSSFKGFDLRQRKYKVTAFECKSCPNHCEIRRVDVAGEKPLYYGSRCGKFEEGVRTRKGEHLPRLFKERETMLRRAYTGRSPRAGKLLGKTLVIPQVAHYFELFPFWNAFFSELGFDVETTADTNRPIIQAGCENVSAETCFPIKVAHGHLLDAFARRPDYIFLPAIINMTHTQSELEHSFNCPYVQSIPYITRSAIDFTSYDSEVLSPTLHFEYGPKEVEGVLRRLARRFVKDDSVIANAFDQAYEAQRRFYDSLLQRGKEVLDSLGEDEIAIVVVSRPYNGCDPALNLNIPEKLRDLGVLAIPMDFLPLDRVDLATDYPHMYWKYGQRIMAAAKIMRNDRRLKAIYITNFGCGPDSFISKFFGRELGSPYLTIEIDEHSADVGAITRCEAYLDSLRSTGELSLRRARTVFSNFNVRTSGDRRTIYVPYMDDHALMLAAAMRANGVDAETLPMTDEEGLQLGRKYTSGKECYPAILTTGDILKKALSPGFDPDRSAFFMPTAFGPCRFGQYNKFHRMILDDLGFENVPLVLLDQTKDFHGDISNLGPNFRRTAWMAIVYVDQLQKAVRERRPLEVVPGSADALYRHFLHEAQETIERRGSLVQLARRTGKALRNLAVDRSRRLPKIGFIGEAYVRCHQFAHSRSIRKIEELGALTVVATLQEWIDYISMMRKYDYRRDRNYKGLAKEHLSTVVQRLEERRVRRPFDGLIDEFFEEAPTEHVFELARPYLDWTVRGEAVLSMGRCVEYAKAGFDGVVNLIPFNCMPGTIVNALLTAFQKDFGIPVLKLAFDGTDQASADTRLEAFVHQAAQRARCADVVPVAACESAEAPCAKT